MKKTSKMIALCLVLTMIATAALPFGVMIAAASEGYTVNFFDTVEDASSLGNYTAWSSGQYDFDSTTFADKIGYDGTISFPTDGEKRGIQAVLDTPVTAEEGKYMEIEYDITDIKTGTYGSQYKVGFNGNTSYEFLNVLPDGRAQITNKSGYVIAAIPEMEQSDFHRYKFTFRTVKDSSNKIYWQLISFKRDGKEALSENLDNIKFGNTINTIHFRRGTNVNDTTTYFDNISVVTYFSEDGTSPVPDRYKLLNLIKTSYKNAGAKLDAGVINNDVYNNVMSRINNALSVFKTAEQNGYDSALGRLETIESMLGAYDKMKEDGTKIYIDSDNTSISEEAGLTTVSVPVYSSDLSEPVMAKIMTMIYQKDNDLYSGKLLDIILSEKEIGANEDEFVASSINLDSYGDRIDLYLKVVPVFEYDEIASKLVDTVDFYKPQDGEIGPEFSFIGEVGASKAILNDDPATVDFKITFTVKGKTEEAGNSVSVLVIKPNKTIDDVKANPKDAIEYYNTATLNAEGKAVFELVPQGGKGYYNYVVIKGGKATADKIFFASYGDIEDVLSTLYTNKSVANLTEDDLATVSLNSSAYTDAEPAGVNVDNVLKEVLEEKDYDARALGEFSSSFLTKLKLVTDIRSATSSDEIMDFVDEYGSYLTSVTALKKLSSSKQQKAFIKIKDGRKNAVDIKTTNKLISDIVKSIKSDEISGGGGGGGSISSGSGGKVLTGGFTATTEDTSKNDNTQKETVMEQAEKLFDDIDGVDWAKTAIMSFAVNGWVSGKADGKFAPDDNITREEFIKIAVNVFGFYNKDAKADFSDSNENDWHYSYIASAVSNGIVNGVSGDRFGTGANITREDMAVIIYRIANMKKLPLTLDGEYLGYADDELISDYAKEAVTGLSKSGVINGTDNDSFSPKGFATRAEAVKMIYEAYNLK